ncbi:hypothetical protein PN462_15375 [Spirulina sp. CS-785/01]|uniref:DUF6930 domain-containing protein n=1 Tax=Spirulina sp. CS-785/01 TaxID=3021716 RepID=UPI00232C4176|nr:hypothetical protein [Spirulina sp. CS-785/01]MDB9314492.1 hypothetical protein [Spirulina sp. CS-785/01]
MTSLPANTLRRLNKIPQSTSVWEGDRFSVDEISPEMELEGERGDCIVWVDGSEGMIRSMEVIPPKSGVEALARTLIQAIETPKNPEALPMRPQKIVVRDREGQFFLRGALQDLNISVEYAPDLPLIDALYQQTLKQLRPPHLPEKYSQLLLEMSQEVWETAPWTWLGDHQIFSIEVNYGDMDTVYVSLLGMMGGEYGLILYRSLESLQRFREAITSRSSIEDLTEAFLAQDCWFLNYQAKDPEGWDFDEEEDDLADLPDDEIMPQFGSLHPMEGQRLFLDEEEAIAVYLALNAFINFFDTYSETLDLEHFPQLRQKCRVQLPPPVPDQNQDQNKSVAIEVATLPQVSQDLLELSKSNPVSSLMEGSPSAFNIRNDLIPDKSVISLGALSWDVVYQLRDNSKTYTQWFEFPEEGEALPTIFIQSTRPKIKEVIEQLDDEGGIESVLFNPGEDPMTETTYNLGILQTLEDQLYVFAEFAEDNPEHLRVKETWEDLLEQTDGYCGIVFAMGASGASRGNPKMKDMLGFFIVQMIDPEDIGLTPLQLVPQFDFDD